VGSIPTAGKRIAITQGSFAALCVAVCVAVQLQWAFLRILRALLRIPRALLQVLGSFVDALGGKTAVSRYSQKIHWLWGTLTYSFVNTNTSTNQMSPIHPQII